MAETYEAVYDAYPDAVVIVDYFGIIVKVNKQAEAMFGYDKGELLGYSVETLIPEKFVKSHQKYRQAYTNKPVKREMKNGYVLTAARKDGSEFFAEISLSPIKIGKKNLVASFIRDVTIRKSLELRFQKMVAEVQDYAILFLDIYGNITNWNKGVERIKGYTEEEVVGKNFRIFYSPEDQSNEKPERLLDSAITYGRAEEEGWRIRKDGSLFWGFDTITTIRDEWGHFIGFSKVTRDLTERKKADELLKKQSTELEAKNKELEHFAFVASHDLQEPLNTVSGMIQLIKEESKLTPDKEIESYFTYIDDALVRMRDLIKDLLEYSRLGRNRKLVKVNMSSLVDSVVRDLGKSIKQKGAIINVDTLPEITAYGVELRLVFQNLISNALKFSKSDTTPKITIKAIDIGTYWRFSIKDNGIGINEKYLQKIFIIFQRISGHEHRGTGIGLAHCKKIVEIHQGSIWVESKLGSGSTFYFTISKRLMIQPKKTKTPEAVLLL